MASDKYLVKKLSTGKYQIIEGDINQYEERIGYELIGCASHTWKEGEYSSDEFAKFLRNEYKKSTRMDIKHGAILCIIERIEDKIYDDLY